MGEPYRGVMSESKRQRARELAEHAMAAGDPVGWFEDLYLEAKNRVAVVPWADRRPNPHLVSWPERNSVAGPSLVVGCGLGDDAEWVAAHGLGPVVAFDVSTTAIEEAERRFGGIATFVAADLFSMPAAWHEAFGFVVEAYTLQVLPEPLRPDAMAAIARTVRQDGMLLEIARGREEDDPAGAMPWPLARSEFDVFDAAGLRCVSFEDFADPEEPDVRRFRASFQRTD